MFGGVTMKRIFIISIILILLISSYLFIPKPKTNYDMTSYLPYDSMTLKGMEILENEFGTESAIQILIFDIDVYDVIELKTNLLSISHVINVVWLDNFVDLNTIPFEWIDEDTIKPFYQDQDALITILFDLNSYDPRIESIIESVLSYTSNYEVLMRGQSIDHINSKKVAEQEIIKVMILIIPVILIILLLASKTWLEPLLILMNLGVAVLFNVLTNGLLGDISYITKSLAIALQLALSIDYSLILIHRYYELRNEHDAKTAAYLALKTTFKSVTGSAFTTMIGFSALMIMNYKIGLDIGLVLSKGIFFSYLSSIILLPILLSWTNRWMDQSKHRNLIPKFKIKANFIHRFKYVWLICFIIIFGLSAFFQTEAKFFYGSTALSQTQKENRELINQRFGSYSPIVILTSNTTIIKETEILNILQSYEEITSIESLLTTVDPLVPREFLPNEILETFIGENYTRWIIYTNLSGESEISYNLIKNLKSDLVLYDTYLISEQSALYEIRDIIKTQETWITLLAIISVMIVIGIIFKSFLIPIVLVAIIQAAIWINVSMGYFFDIKVQYIGYLVVMSIQLGATIDYAILLTSRYLENRKSLSPDQAMKRSYQQSFSTIMISGTILAIAGFIEGIFSNIGTVTDIGFLLGRGAIISSVMVILFLPSLLKLIDRLIISKKEN